MYLIEEHLTFFDYFSIIFIENQSNINWKFSTRIFDFFESDIFISNNIFWLFLTVRKHGNKTVTTVE